MWWMTIKRMLKSLVVFRIRKVETCDPCKTVNGERGVGQERVVRGMWTNVQVHTSACIYIVLRGKYRLATVKNMDNSVLYWVAYIAGSSYSSRGLHCWCMATQTSREKGCELWCKSRDVNNAWGQIEKLSHQNGGPRAWDRCLERGWPDDTISFKVVMECFW